MIERSLTHHCDSLKSQSALPQERKNKDTVCALMIKTFPGRCRMLVNEFKHIREIIERCPLLWKIRWEFILCRQQFQSIVLNYLVKPTSDTVNRYGTLESLDYQKLQSNINVYQTFPTWPKYHFNPSCQVHFIIS